MGEIADQLLERLNASLESMSLNQLARETSVDVAILHRWIKGERSISLENADKLVAYYGLELKPPAPMKKKPKK
jgi:plasmid maintenance system antidote protein VapI